MGYGPNIKAARKKAGLTQEQLAKKCGIATITLRQYELEKRKPSLKTVEKIAEKLLVNPLDLAGDGDEVSIHWIDIDEECTISSDLSGKTKSFQPFTETDNQLIQLGGFSAISEFYNLSEEDQKKALEDIRGFAEYVIEKYKKQASEDKKAPPQPE